MKPPRNTILDRLLVKAVKTGARCILGFASDESGTLAATHTRIYPSLEDLTVYFSIEDRFIEHHEPSVNPVEPSAFLIAHDAELTLTKTTAAGEDGNFLKGSLTQTFTFGIADLGNVLPKSRHVWSCINLVRSDLPWLCIVPFGTNSHVGPGC